MIMMISGELKSGETLVIQESIDGKYYEIYKLESPQQKVKIKKRKKSIYTVREEYIKKFNRDITGYGTYRFR